MYGIFVHQNRYIKYADLIACGYKTIETRNRNTLKSLVGKRVAIVRTESGKRPCVVGYADIARSAFCKACDFQNYNSAHCVPPGSKYDCNGKGKWFYYMTNAEACTPFLLPQSAVYHGRSFCEF